MTIDIIGVTPEGRCENCGLLTKVEIRYYDLDTEHKNFMFCSVCHARHDFIIRPAQSPKELNNQCDTIAASV
jgi:transcription elongation factor Elf1